jgi:thioredoxin reductase
MNRGPAKVNASPFHDAGRPDYDAIVIGGGPAGLSAALYLGRFRRRTLVVDAGKPRNASSPAAHGLLTRDGVPPGELLSEARRQLAAYASVALRRGEVVSAEPAGDGFIVRLDDGGEAQARRLLLACGVRDELPAIEGLRERWGVSVLHCTNCHGYEAADLPLALIARGDVAVGAAAAVLQVSRDLVLCTAWSSGLAEIDKRRLAERGVRVIETAIARVTGAPPRLVIHFADGSSLVRSAIFVRAAMRLASELPAQLGCKLDAPHRLCVGPTWETSVRGVYAAGDIAAKDQIAIAVASGAQAAIALNGDLVQEDFALERPAPMPSANRVTARDRSARSGSQLR